jgi:transcriptional regulator with XRE-family HTH domain
MQWSTVDLAEATGLTPQNIRQLEAGEQAPRTWTIYLIAAALECSAGWLAFGG